MDRIEDTLDTFASHESAKRVAEIENIKKKIVQSVHDREDGVRKRVV